MEGEGVQRIQKLLNFKRRELEGKTINKKGRNVGKMTDFGGAGRGAVVDVHPMVQQRHRWKRCMSSIQNLSVVLMLPLDRKQRQISDLFFLNKK